VSASHSQRELNRWSRPPYLDRKIEARFTVIQPELEGDYPQGARGRAAAAL